jgi:predicted phage tail protein
MKVFLHGKLGKKFGKKWDLNIETPAEALRAIDANTNGFFKYIAAKENENVKYRIFIDKKSIRSHEELQLRIRDKKELHFFPRVRGRDDNGDMMMYGGAGMALGWGLGELGASIGDNWLGNSISWLGDVAFEIGAAFLLQGAIGGLMDDPESPATEPDGPAMKNTASFLFARPLNNVIQGASVPLGYGRLRVGSHVVSSSILNSRLNAFDSIVGDTIDEDGNTVGAVSIDQYS